jgi:uncharacterized protein (DUF1330 family)
VSAYVVFTKEKTTDAEELKSYAEKIWPTFEGHEVKVLVGYGRHEVLEGEPVEGVVILEFPTFEAAKAWYESPAYRSIVGHRFKGAIYRGFVATGFSEEVSAVLSRRAERPGVAQESVVRPVGPRQDCF